MSSLKNILAVIGWYSGLGPIIRIFCEPDEILVAYHTINDNNEAYAHISIEFEIFKKQIAYLKKRGYSFYRFKEVFDKTTGKRAYIYFDDGFKTVYKNVYPYLRERNIQATFFVTGDVLLL